MQPRDLWSPPVPQEYIVSDTDRLIAEENARVHVFEHPEETAAVPRQHKLLGLIGEHKTGLLIAFVSILILGAGTAFGMANLHKFTGGNTVASTTTSSSATTATKKDSSSSAADSNDGASDGTDDGSGDSTDEDSSSDGDSGDSTDEDSSSDGDTTDDGSGDSADPSEDEGGDTTPDPNDGAEDPELPAPTPVPSTPVVSTPHKFTVASWNVKTDNTQTAGTEVLALLTKSQIIGLQTLRTKAMRDSVKSKVTCSSCAYAGYQPAYSGSEAGPSDMPIIWNKSAFTLVGTGSNRKMCEAASTSKYSYAARYATWVKLQSKVNSKQFYVVDTHTMGVGESGGKPGTDSLLISRYQSHMTNLKALLAELQKSNIPIYLVGTFNVDYRYDRFAYTSYFPYAAFKPSAIRSSWDLMGLSGISGSAGTTDSGNRIIDYVFTWQRSEITANTIAISTSRHGSDHYAVFFTNTMK